LLLRIGVAFEIPFGESAQTSDPKANWGVSRARLRQHMDASDEISTLA